MKTAFAAAVAALVAATGCSTAAIESDTGYSTPPPGAAGALVPAGTSLEVEMDQTLTTKSNKIGDTFTASVKDNVVVNGSTIVPAGSKVTGRITGIDGSDNIGDQAAIRLSFESIEVNGRTHAFAADITDTDVDLTDRANVSQVAEKAGVGAAAGAVIGAVIGGSLKDILVGGVLGAGAGTIISLGMGDQEAALPKGSDLTLRTTRAIACGG
jgi:hypothetical protein